MEPGNAVVPRNTTSTATDPLSTVTIGSTDVRITRLGLGTSPLGGWPSPMTEELAQATIRAAWSEGLRYFDTAPLYGYGQAETWLGQALQTEARRDFTILTKVGLLLREPDTAEEHSFFHGTTTSKRPVWDFSYEGVKRSLGESLERMGVDSVDIVLLHDPDDHLDEALDGAYVALHELRSEGVIRAIGAGTTSPESLAYLIRRGDFDCVLVAGRYTLLDQSALDELLPLSAEKGVSVIVGGVYNSGILVDPTPPATYDYVDASEEVTQRAFAIRDLCRQYGVDLAAAAIQFPLAHPAVAGVVIGARSPAEIRQNVELMRADIPQSLWLDMRDQGLLAPNVPVSASPR